MLNGQKRSMGAATLAQKSPEATRLLKMKLKGHSITHTGISKPQSTYCKPKPGDSLSNGKLFSKVSAIGNEDGRLIYCKGIRPRKLNEVQILNLRFDYRTREELVRWWVWEEKFLLVTNALWMHMILISGEEQSETACEFPLNLDFFPNKVKKYDFY